MKGKRVGSGERVRGREGDKDGGRVVAVFGLVARWFERHLQDVTTTNPIKQFPDFLGRTEGYMYTTCSLNF